MRTDILAPEDIDPETYHAVVGPSLRAAAEVAAERGDPTLAADMPAMLALIELVGKLGGLRAETCTDIDPPTRDWLAGAPAAACVMVMQEAKLEESAIGQCLAALEAAHAQIHAHAVTAAGDELLRRAALQLDAGEHKLAMTSLKQAVRAIVTAIEAWRESTH